jgi:hypothetical protein
MKHNNDENFRYNVLALIQAKANQYIGFAQDDLKSKFQIFSNAKNINSIIISRMIDLTAIAPEYLLYIKKNCVFKTAVLSENNKISESMSFPAIDYYDMLKNDWKDSQIFKYFSQKTFCIFIFKREGNIQRFLNVFFLKLGGDEISQIYSIWLKVKNLVANNEITLGGKNGFSVENYPKKEEGSVVHIRPHDSNSAEGKVLLPSGQRIMNYCFWLNNNYIESKIGGFLDG